MCLSVIQVVKERSGEVTVQQGSVIFSDLSVLLESHKCQCYIFLIKKNILLLLLKSVTSSQNNVLCYFIYKYTFKRRVIDFNVEIGQIYWGKKVNRLLAASNSNMQAYVDLRYNQVIITLNFSFSSVRFIILVYIKIDHGAIPSFVACDHTER